MAILHTTNYMFSITTTMEGSADHDHERWSSTIPPEIIELILKRLSCCMADCIRFGAVCKLWRSKLLENRHLLSSCVHLLLLPEDEKDCELLDITTDRFYKLPSLPKELTTFDTTGFGSSFGWLLIMNYKTFQMQLLNPITRAQISLPPPATFANFDDQDSGEPHLYKYFGRKAVLSCDPNSNKGDCLVMAIHGYKANLGFCKVGGDRWTSIEFKMNQQYVDVAFHKGRFYALTQRGMVVAPDLGPDLTVKVIAQPQRYGCCEKKYLVELLDELLVVTRYIKTKYVPSATVHNDYDVDDYATDEEEDEDEDEDDDDDDDDDSISNYGDDYSDADVDDIQCIYKTKNFAIHRVDVETGEWEEVTNLGDRMLFLGSSGSISISVKDMPGCKPNHIYFTDDFEDYLRVGNDIGVYSLEDNSIQPFSSSTHLWPLSMFWVTLSPW